MIVMYQIVGTQQGARQCTMNMYSMPTWKLRLCLVTFVRKCFKHWQTCEVTITRFMDLCQKIFNLCYRHYYYEQYQFLFKLRRHFCFSNHNYLFLKYISSLSQGLMYVCFFKTIVWYLPKVIIDMHIKCSFRIFHYYLQFFQ